MSRASRPAPATNSASVAAFASLSIPTGSPKRSDIRPRKSRSESGMFTEPRSSPDRWSIRDGMPKPSATTLSPRSSSTDSSSPASSSRWDPSGVGRSRRCSTFPSRSTMPASTFVPPRSTPMTRCPSKGRGYPTPSMARAKKPYRVYKGGRVKGKVPLERPQRQPRRDRGEPAPPRARRPRRRWSWKKRIAIGVLVLLLVSVLWAAIGFFQFRQGVSSANSRLDKSAPGVTAALAHQNGLLLSKPTTILLLGSDHVNNDQRATLNHSDSIMLLRTNPGRHRLASLSIPRDLRVEVPGYGEQKINAAMQIGGPALAVRTIEHFTGLGVNHV